MKWVRVSLLLLALILLSFLTGMSVHLAKAQSQTVSSVWIDPLKTCCLTPGSSLNVVVKANLTAGEQFSGFDVKLNYTTVAPNGRLNYTYNNLGYFNKVVNATRMDSSSSVFANGVVGYECIDGILISGPVCPSDDASVGQVRFFLNRASGIPLVGPSNGLTLFTVQFNVTGSGTVVFALDYAGLKNPGSNLSAPNVHDIQVVKSDGVFSNKGVAAFFNAGPANPPAILPNQDVIFDASGSFSIVSSAMSDVSGYRWDFGDGNQSSTGPVVTHRFRAPGWYQVQLNVTDKARNIGTLVRPVVVLPALGGLDLQVKNQIGNALRGNVKVQLFNSSVLSSPFLNKIVDQTGGAAFRGLKPDSYVLKFSGPTIQNLFRTEDVTPGWTTQDTVYVIENFPPSPPPDYSGIISVGTILGGLGIFTGAMVVRRRSLKRRALGQKRAPVSKIAGRTRGKWIASLADLSKTLVARCPWSRARSFLF